MIQLVLISIIYVILGMFGYELSTIQLQVNKHDDSNMILWDKQIKIDKKILDKIK